MKTIPEKMYVYTLRSSGFVLYVGVTRDPEVRLDRHKTGSCETSKALRRFANLVMVIECECAYAEAFERERECIEKYASRHLLNRYKRTREKASRSQYVSHLNPNRDAEFKAAIRRSKVGQLLGF